MPVNAVMQWALLALSLINAILLLWLGMTVLLNAERRGWGIWVAAAALGTGTLFFLFHTVIINLGLDRVTPGIIARWPLAWLVGFAQPFAWYLVMLWHGGFWTQPRAVRHRRWHIFFLLALLIIVAVTGILALTFPLSLLHAYPPAALLSGPTIGNVSMLAVVYSLMVIGCIAMSLDILLFPAPSSRLLGDVARRRARPWLIATSLAELAVCLLLGWTLVRVAPGLLDRPPGHVPHDIWLTLVWSDLLICLFVNVAVLLLGQAAIAYELFTGTTLPRHGQRRQWRNMIIVAVTYSALMALALVRHTPPVYGILFTALLLAAFYALHNWRSYAEREHFMASLRPFVAGPRVTEALLPGEVPDATAAAPFHALCDDVLGARWACLTAGGSFAALVQPLTHPANAVAPEIPAALLARCSDPRTLYLELEPGVCGVAMGAVPLWSTRGFIGLLLLGEKRDGGLYTHEEIEVARTAGERLIDALAGAQMARRLMQVQRARLADDQLADRRGRRVIHDDILPQIHTVMLALSNDPAQAATVTQLAEIHHALAALLRDLPATAALDITHHGILGALRSHIERSCDGAFTAVAWHLDPATEARTRTLSPLVAEVLYGAAREAIRNAARYGRGTDPTRPLTLTVELRDTDPPALTIADDGIGLAHAAPSTGSGQGMLLHGAMMALIGGAWNVDSTPDTGTRVTLTLPCDES